MVIRMRKAALFLVISLAAAVISLGTEGQAVAATFPSAVAVQNFTWSPPAGFGPVLGKIARDSSNNVYVTDVEKRSIVKFNFKGEYLTTFSMSAHGRPYGLAVMKNGTMVVTFIYPRPKVVMFGPDGSVLAQQGSFALPTQKFQSPIAVALDSLENIYVLDAGSFEAPTVVTVENFLLKTRFVQGSSQMCVQVFDKNGTAITTNVAAYPSPWPQNSFGYPSLLQDLAYNTPGSVPEDGALMSPEAIIYDPLTKTLAVGDTLNGRVQYFGAADYTTDTTKRYKYLSKVGDFLASDLNGIHMANPTGVAMDNHANGSRLYVVDKVLKRIQVIDPVAKALRGTIDEVGYPALDMVYPRDLFYHMGSLLIANEQGPNVPNLQTVSLDNSPWPPTEVRLNINYVQAMTDSGSTFPNIGQRAGNTFPITGQMEPGADVTYVCNQYDGAGREFSGTCTPTRNGGVALDDYSCTLQFSTLQTDQDCVITATVAASGSHADVAVEHMNYKPTGALTYAGPIVTMDPIAPEEQYRKSTTITISGTVDYSAAGNTLYPGKELKIEIKNSANQAKVFAIVDTTGTQNVKTWTATVPLVANDTNTLTPRAYVELSLPTGSTPASQNVIVDTIPPGVEFSFYKDGSVVMERLQNAAGLIAEKNLESVTLLINGVPAMIDSDPVAVKTRQFPNSESHYFSAAALLSKNGVNKLQVVARDKAGNEGRSLEHEVVLNPMQLPIGAAKLKVDATAQADNLFYAKHGVELTFSGDAPANTSTVYFNDELATLTGSRWTWPTLKYVTQSTEQVVPIAIEATGTYGKVSKLRSLYVHTGAPTAAITKPAEDIATNAGSNYTFQVAVAPSATNPTTQITSVVVELTDKDGTAVFVPAQTFTNLGINPTTVTTTPVNLTKPGVYTLKATVSNGIAGETSVVYRNVLYDVTKPSVGIAIDSSPTPVATVQGFVEPGATISATYNGSPVTVNFDVTNPSLWSVPNGSYFATPTDTLEVIATDAAGNTNTRRLSLPKALPDADLDGDSTLRVYDAIIALRAVVTGTADAETLRHGDIAPLVNGMPAPDGLMTLADAQYVLMKVEGKPWQ